MNRTALIACVGVLTLGACTSAQVSTAETDAQAVLSDITAAEPLIAAIPGVPSWAVADLTLADNGLTAILAAVKANSTTVESASLSGLQTALTSLKKDLPANATVQTDAGIAQTALTALQASETSSTEIQAFTAVAALALAVEQAEEPATARVGATSPISVLVDDGNTHLHNLGR